MDRITFLHLTMDLQLTLSLFILIQGTTGTVSGGRKSENNSPASAAEIVSNDSSSAPLRSGRFKRCSCSSLMDKECVYFCHLDIIWINTPERTVPYGLGGPRMKRALQDTDQVKLPESTSRCVCAKHKDKKCLGFCQTAAELSFQPYFKKDKRKGLRKQHTSNKIIKRPEDVKHSIRNSFAFANLVRKLSKTRGTSHPWTHKYWSVWKHMKTMS
ncbi:hypothetical protein GDO86_011246 [Hymenochirus boettgeri]|uniref:Endothelin-1 n=1 Tax=Hymenochirus boettgeri TaxID=247094 RepID=A0A8T2JFN5_9PIPI|nr:hypothetical protein GDO86_011246 [Hymenochirus boettgeri]